MYPRAQIALGPRPRHLVALVRWAWPVLRYLVVPLVVLGLAPFVLVVTVARAAWGEWRAESYRETYHRARREAYLRARDKRNRLAL